MSGLWPIFKRELFSLFVTPLAWVLGTAFLLLQGMHFYLIVSHFAAQSEIAADAGPVETFFGQTVLLYLPLLFVCPVLTMGLFAEERRCPRCGAYLNPERREAERRRLLRRQNPPDEPGPPEPTDDRRATDRRAQQRRTGGSSGGRRDGAGWSD